MQAVRRNDFRALLRATADRDRLATLIRLFIAGQTEPADAVRAALAPLGLTAAVYASVLVAGFRNASRSIAIMNAA